MSWTGAGALCADHGLMAVAHVVPDSAMLMLRGTAQGVLAPARPVWWCSTLDACTDTECPWADSVAVCCVKAGAPLCSALYGGHRPVLGGKPSFHS